MLELIPIQLRRYGSEADFQWIENWQGAKVEEYEKNNEVKVRECNKIWVSDTVSAKKPHQTRERRECVY